MIVTQLIKYHKKAQIKPLKYHNTIQFIIISVNQMSVAKQIKHQNPLDIKIKQV